MMIRSILKDRACVWLAIGLAINFTLTVAIAAGLITTGDTIRDAFRETGAYQIVRVVKFKPFDTYGVDSWWPMINAYERKIENPEHSMYTVFFEDQIKFQYPPSSLLILDLFPASMTRLVDGKVGEPLIECLGRFSQGAVFLTALVSAAILAIGLRHLEPDRPARPARIIVQMMLATVIGLTYYPILKAHQLGQIQVFLTGLVALGLLCYLLKWEVLSGVFFGVCCLVKPQYGLILLWALLRRRWAFALGLTGVSTVGLALSVFRFGLQDHFRYLKVLQEISRAGEAYWPNQSVNGLLNRFLENGDPIIFSMSDFAPPNPAVYAITLLSSLVFLALALWLPASGRRTSGSEFDLAIVLAAVTFASPIAWEHHYGTFLPILAIALPGLLRALPLGRATALPLALSFVAMANAMLRPDLIFVNRWWGLAGSHLFFGGLITFGLLLALRAGGGSRGIPAAERRMTVPAKHTLKMALFPESVQEVDSSEHAMTSCLSQEKK
jgi:alpha-1,2-mannosyltransferase